ncbi:short chain dehydrogenase [Ceratobasidium sp. AG-Ba]|nr:short chain dehydrogenase [Ceratobasidium sp. AG-Ba]
MRLPEADLQGKTAIVTGANSGIGYEIRTDTGSNMVEMELMDCENLESVRNFVKRWSKRESKRVDILINNAGAIPNRLVLTSDGFERTYQVNHLSHVLLTTLLLNGGHMALDARIVSVSSMGFYLSDSLDLSSVDNSDIITKYHAISGSSLDMEEMGRLYERSKASQAVWVMVLQHYLSRSEHWSGITVHSCHPGIVRSPIWTQSTGAGSVADIRGKVFIAIMKAAGITNEQGAAVPVWLATASEPASAELRGMFWNRMRWMWVWPWSLETKRQNDLWDKWCMDAKVSLLV